MKRGSSPALSNYGLTIMNIEKRNVLVIDDNEDILRLVEATLQRSEFKVLKASGGREGIQIAREQKPDLILLDIMMPDVDGFMTSNFLKQYPETKNIPIIFLTAEPVNRNETLFLSA